MLYSLFRHGEAEYRAGSDASRKLTESGRMNNQSIAQQLIRKEAKFSHALCSPYRRAQQTASGLKSVYPALRFEECDLLTPDSDLNRLVGFLESYCPDSPDTSLLLVGHNPLLSRLLNFLLDEGVGIGRSLDTSHLVCLNIAWPGRGGGQLNYWLQP